MSQLAFQTAPPADALAAAACLDSFVSAFPKAELARPAVVQISVSHPDGLALLAKLDATLLAVWCGMKRELIWLKAGADHLSLSAFDAEGRMVERRVFPFETPHG